MGKTNISIVISDLVRKKLEKRAKKEMLSVEDLIAEILRRSVLSYTGSSSSDNVDDKFITFFSRKGKARRKSKDSQIKEESSDDEFNPSNFR